MQRHTRARVGTAHSPITNPEVRGSLHEPDVRASSSTQAVGPGCRSQVALGLAKSSAATRYFSQPLSVDLPSSRPGCRHDQGHRIRVRRSAPAAVRKRSSSLIRPRHGGMVAWWHSAGVSRRHIPTAISSVSSNSLPILATSLAHRRRPGALLTGPRAVKSAASAQRCSRSTPCAGR
jgi:hypothetical protein